MIFNKKYKCPVCLEECISLRDRLNFNGKNYITCKNCNSYLRYTRISSVICSIFSYTLAGFMDYFYGPYDFPLFIFIFGPILYILCLKFFGELEHYVPEEPKFNLNKFLDGLRNQNSKG